MSDLHSAFMTKDLTPEQMPGELTIACNALTASGADVFARNKHGRDGLGLVRCDHARREYM